jgi:hypothetical protein
LQEFTAATVAKILHKRSENTATWSINLKKLIDGSFGDLTVYAEYVTQKDRLIFMLNKNELILLDIGGHDVQQEYAHLSPNVRHMDIETAAKPATWFKELISGASTKKSKKKASAKITKPFPVKSAILNPGAGGEEAFRWWQEAELSETWIQYLDEQQANTSDRIFSKITSKPKSFQVFYICGGPGTGKTVILLNLAINLNHEKVEVGFELSKPVLSYLNSGKQKVPGTNLAIGAAEVHLIDDPVSSDRLGEIIRKAKAGKCRALVVALDPLQWHERDTRFAAFNRLMAAEDSLKFDLDVCYRQSQVVGKEVIEISRNIFTKSSRFLISDKQSKEFKLIEPYFLLATKVKFVDESGRSRLYTQFDKSELEREIARFKNRDDLWTHTSPIAFVYDDSIGTNCRSEVKELAEGINRIDLKISEYRRIRGVEFQELFMFLSKDYWDKLSGGAAGLNSADWERLTCLYTIASRPKDGLVIFLID